MSDPSLKTVPGFEDLTSAERGVFERELAEKSFRSGASIPLGTSLLMVVGGSIRIAVETAVEPITVAVIERGGLVGELAFFEPDPVSLQAQGQLAGIYYAIERSALKTAFRYCRTGAIKFMVAFARSLSHKIRSANDVDQGLALVRPASAGRPAQLEQADLERLMMLAGTRRYKEGDVLFREGDAGRELFVIRDGEVEILKEQVSGGPVSLARLGPGEFFGEMAFVDERPRSASAVARSPLQVHMLPAGSLDRAVDGYNVGMGLYLTSLICKIMARRLNVTLGRLRGS